MPEFGNRSIAGAVLLMCFLAHGRATLAGEAADPYFLSPTNPLATVDQNEATERALRILQTPEGRNAREMVVLRWKAVLHDDPPHRERRHLY